MGINDITGDSLTSKVGDKEKFDRGYDLIWGKKGQNKPPERTAQKWTEPDNKAWSKNNGNEV